MRPVDIAVPLGELTQRLVVDPTTEGLDQSGLVRNRDELIWRDNPSCWVPPANECLSADGSMRSGLHDRLVVHLEFVFGERLSQLAFQRQSPHRTKVKIVVEDRVPVATTLLRLVHGGVGVTQERGGIRIDRR